MALRNCLLREIPQSMLTICHAPHFPENDLKQRIIACIQHLKMLYQEFTVCQDGKIGLVRKLFQEEKKLCNKNHSESVIYGCFVCRDPLHCHQKNKKQEEV